MHSISQLKITFFFRFVLECLTTYYISKCTILVEERQRKTVLFAHQNCVGCDVDVENKMFSLHHCIDFKIYWTLYHWNALNWLLKLLVVLLAVGLIRLPKPVNGWFVVGTPCGVPKLLLLTLLLKLLLAKFVVICDAIVVGLDCGAFTGLCAFNWFMDNDGPIDFDFDVSKLSKSMLMPPAFDHVWPTISNVVGFVCVLLSFALVDVGCKTLVFVGSRMSAEKIQKKKKEN